MNHITNMLQNIAATKNIQLLYACETGSRAWGFPSPDSDYDVRFIYRHQKDWYLHLGTKKDTVEIMDGDWDITGWDLRKSLVLLKKSNASLIERFQSPIVYYADDAFANEYKKLIENYYSPTAVFYHHYSLAKKFWDELKDASDIKLKSYFYLVRSLLSCNWIVRDKSVLPMHIEGLMQYTTEENKQLLSELITLKATVGEKYLHKKDAAMHHLVEDLFTYIEPAKDSLGVNNTSMALLDEFFVKTLYANPHY
jgi:predicted nucleotidyltransferase